MHEDAVGERRVEAPQRLLLVDRDSFARRQGVLAAALDDASLPHHDRLARQHPLDAGEDRVAAGGELHLQQLVARRRGELALDDAGLDQRLRFRGEGEVLRRLGVVERLDAKGIARQHQPPGCRVVQGDRVHAANDR